MGTGTKSTRLDRDSIKLPTDYPLKEALGIYARRLGVLLTGSTMIIGIGTLGAWFSILLAPMLYLSSSKVRAIVNRRFTDAILALVVIVLGLSFKSIFDLGFLSSLLVYATIVSSIIFIFKRK